MASNLSPALIPARAAGASAWTALMGIAVMHSPVDRIFCGGISMAIVSGG